VSRADAVKGLEAVIRAVWPARPSRFPPLCPTCDDVGWQLVRCTHARRCGRWRCSGAEEAWTHTLVVACPCPKGDPYRRSGTRPVERPEDAVEAASHTRRRRGGLSRLAG
jgi:hypothetical protein